MKLLLFLAAQPSATENLIYYIAAGVLTVAVLIGIAMMSKVETSVKGNLLGAISMLLAIVLTLWYFNIFTVIELWIAMLVGLAIGITAAMRVKMIQMPQMVGLLNGLGGGASMLAGILTLIAADPFETSFSLITAGLAIFVGSLTLTGSLVAAGKLHKVLPQRPIVLKGHPLWTALSLILSLVTVVLLAVPYILMVPILKTLLILLSALLSGAFGIIFAIRVGGADMPITISLLNSLSGVAGAIAGMAIADPLLVAVGGVVGASGLLLTQIMCRAMNRKLLDILLGKTSAQGKPKAKKETVKVIEETAVETVQSPEMSCGCWLRDAERVIIVPGYGMALSQAQSSVKQLMTELEADGKEVKFAIHPVAGRMPGHMNVLLAEVDIPYDKLYEMQDINEDFKDADVVIVIGANDVVNPAANTAEGTPIYGMPILDVEDAKSLIMCNYDTQPGYAGVDNPLYEGGREHIALMLGDAKETLGAIMSSYREGDGTDEVTPSGEAMTTELQSGTWLRDAERVIIVPGYGMALSQAQSAVKQLMTELEQEGKEVSFAIHPVAGRMPGHMNVLLAEVDIPYDKLKEMDEVNPEFKNTDVAIIIGANDVINPAANTAEGTPIYGMPILDVEDAKHVIICNFDKLPGYAGVDNPLYEEGRTDRIALMLGDAKETLDAITKAFRTCKVQPTVHGATASPEQKGGRWLADAARVIIVPGYGMALSQAQSTVKSLMMELEQQGKEVKFAIHPVAGRMPGHMNVLLAEVDVPYDKLYEMQDINPEFEETDVAIIIGANDVINPAANTAEGTPIYGMPILDVEDAKHVIICNFDKLPGYAGVDNPLYEEGHEDHIALLLGDAKETLGALIREYRGC
ncbi:MAG: NAD(P)(+) transhydrogenase (Re/Si-specific) subunit beta [Clostridiales bacterium]|nr:NAD(P)(+) transhydrogenase (Re/Si-specific) subunit beta [Clostridiales bacterium]MDD4186391.1 NAD(P)(+) transhydrogenase (Re/Si-specific) subunit beta [Eubacteriales bacterium]